MIIKVQEKAHYMISRNDYIYKIYLQTDKGLFFLEDKFITDINLGKTDNAPSEDKMEIDFNDEYFFNKINNTEIEDFYIVAQVYNRNNHFIQQIEFSSEVFTIEKSKMNLHFEQLNLNKAWSSVNPKWIDLAEKYKSERLSTLRTKAIESLTK